MTTMPMPASPLDVGPDHALLEDLRARMQAVLARTAHKASPPRPVDQEPLPFVSEERSSGLLHIRRQRFAPSHRTGRAPLLPARTANANLLALLALDPSIAECDLERAVYLDTETTGLSGGTGTVAFLVGLAYWDVSRDPAQAPTAELVLEQLLVRNLGEEAPMLEHVAERLQSASAVVTYNGKAFDLPLIRTRCKMARLPALVEPPHLDLLHIARRLHKPRGVTCKLTILEETILGFERHDDIPSGDVSACYLHFLRTGNARPLLQVVEHNAWDVIAMVALVGLYGEPLDGSQLDVRDLVGVARTFKKAGQLEEAYAVANRAVLAGAGNESLRCRAELAKARGDRARALNDFESLAATVDCQNVRLELSKLYEHFVKEPTKALAWAERGTGETTDRLSHRVSRLGRKIARKMDRVRQAHVQAELPQAPRGSKTKPS